MKINNQYNLAYKSVVVNKTKKRQIILAHSASSLDDYLVKIKTRYNGNYDKIPAYIIGLDGVIYELFNPQSHTNFMGDESVDKIAIIIVLENYGWLTKDPFEEKYFDWKGHEYHGDILKTEWRQKKIWSVYSDDQMISLVDLINDLTDRFNISKDFVGDNISTHKPKTFKGVMNRSNYTKDYYDLSPAFNFEKLSEFLNKKTT